MTALGSLISAALNVNVTCWRSGPAAAELELLTVRWLKEMLGYPAHAAGLLVSGGSMANFAGLAAARSARAPANVVRDGMAAAGARMCVYVSEEGHFSVRKAPAMLGIGAANVRTVGTDRRLRMDLADLDRMVGPKIAAGHLPLPGSQRRHRGELAFVPLTAWPISPAAKTSGCTSMPLTAVRCAGALGPPFLRGHREADSVALDPQSGSFRSAAVAFCTRTPPRRVQRGRRLRACWVWSMTSPSHSGTTALNSRAPFARWIFGCNEISWAAARATIERNIACAKYFEELVTASDDFEMLAPVELSIFCFRARPPGFTGDLDALNERMLIALQRGGSSYLSNARIHGKFALRGCVLNYRTTRQDMERLLEDLRSAIG